MGYQIVCSDVANTCIDLQVFLPEFNNVKRNSFDRAFRSKARHKQRRSIGEISNESSEDQHLAVNSKVKLAKGNSFLKRVGLGRKFGSFRRNAAENDKRNKHIRRGPSNLIIGDPILTKGHEKLDRMKCISIISDNSPSEEKYSNRRLSSSDSSSSLSVAKSQSSLIDNESQSGKVG